MTGFVLKSEKKWMVAAALTIVSLIFSVLISKVGVVAGVTFLVGILGLAVVLATLSSYRNGLLITVVFAFGMFHISRILPPSIQDFPLGAIFELLLALTFFSILIHNLSGEHRIDKRLYQNPIATALAIFLFYAVLLLFHPSSTGVVNRVVALREVFMLSFSFYIVIHVFRSFSYIKFFTSFWLFFALLAALYGIYQEIFGLQQWEIDWLYLHPERVALTMIWGHIRKWSFLSDINAFGLFMGYGSIVCFILALGPFPWKKKIYLGGIGLLMLVSMTFSGTRTATAMVVFGFVFFTVLTLNRRSTLLFAGGLILVILAIFFGPFYGSTFNRVRSTFQGSEDVSMSVRDRTRLRMQPYVQTHPIGGGLNTAGKLGLEYEPGHELAGDWDPDSGYLKTAVERGWIGLLVQLGFYATILIYGVVNYFKIEDRMTQTYYGAYLSAFFALTIANYTQDSMDQKPINLILMSSIAFIIQLAPVKQVETIPASTDVKGREKA